MIEFKRMLEARFGIKTSIVGSGDGEVKEARLLNRTTRVMGKAWQ